MQCVACVTMDQNTSFIIIFKTENLKLTILVINKNVWNWIILTFMKKLIRKIKPWKKLLLAQGFVSLEHFSFSIFPFFNSFYF